jgi:hypothetical protein
LQAALPLQSPAILTFLCRSAFLCKVPIADDKASYAFGVLTCSILPSSVRHSQPTPPPPVMKRRQLYDRAHVAHLRLVWWSKARRQQ